MTILPLRSVLSVCAIASFAGWTAGCQEVIDNTAERSFVATVGITDNTFVEGARACVEGADPDNCVMTNEDGRATLMLPRNQEVVWTLTKEDYASYVLADDTGDEWVPDTVTVTMITDSWARRVAVPFGRTHPPVGTGIVVVGATEPVVGAELRLVDGSGEEEVFYSDPDYTPQPDLDHMTSSGVGGFFDVEPGEVEVEILGETDHCRAELGWQTSANNRMRVPVREGRHTYATFRCEPP